MSNQKVENKFTWVIKNFSSLQTSIISSDPFEVGGCKWRLVAYPKGNAEGNFPLLLGVADTETTLPLGWRRHTKCRLTVVNQVSEKLSVRLGCESMNLCDEMYPILGFSSKISLAKLKAHDGGFLVNDELKIVAEVEVLDVIGKLDVTEEFKEVTQEHVRSDLRKESSSVNESIDVNGFQVLPSQRESVKRIFERHPEMALEFRAKNQHLRTACMNVLLNLIETLCQSLQELSHDDLLGAGSALTYVKDSGFKVDWLEKKLEEVKEKKRGEIRIQELEGKVKDFKKKYSEKEALVEKEKQELKDLGVKCSFMDSVLEEEKAKVLAAFATPLTLDDVL